MGWIKIISGESMMCWKWKSYAFFFFLSILQLEQSKETSNEVKLDLFNNILEFYKDKSLFELGCPNCLYQNFTFHY